MDMGGWDVVYASDVAELNKVLAASTTKLLPTFSFRDNKLQLDFSGSFGPWSIQPGGTANRINLRVPVKTGNLTFPAFAKPIQLEGIQPVLNLALKLVEGKGKGSKDLTFDVTSNSVSPSNKDGDIYISNPDESGLLAKRDPTGQAAQLIRDWFGAPLVANKEKISYVFASVLTDPQGQPWLKPKATGISYFESRGGSVQAMGIKTITQSPWGAGGLTTGVDPSLLQSGESMFYALSQAVFMKNLLLPSTAKALHAGSGDLRFNGPAKPSEQDNCSITNARTISLPAVDHAGTRYYPKLTSFRVTISGNQITSEGSGKFDITGLANAYVTFANLRVVNEITYDAARKTLGFKLVSKTSPSTVSHIPWYEKAITWVIPLVGLIVNIVMDIVVATIESAVQDSIKGAGSLSVDTVPLQTAVWSGLEQFNVNQAELSAALVIRGKSS